MVLDARLSADLNLDSIGLLVLLSELELIAQRRVPDEVLGSIQTVREVVGWMEQLAAQSSPTS